MVSTSDVQNRCLLRLWARNHDHEKHCLVVSSHAHVSHELESPKLVAGRNTVLLGCHGAHFTRVMNCTASSEFRH